MKLEILEVTMAKKNNANKYWIYGEDAALAAQFTAYLGKVLKNRRLTYIRHLNKIQAKEYSYEDMAETIEQGQGAAPDDDPRSQCRRGSAWCKRASTQKPKQNGR